MKKVFALFFQGLLVLATTAQTAKKQYPNIDIPYKKFVLDNGLRLLVHEDHKAPIAAFNIWYHVGSKNEKTGKTGFAHLFEHLMFNGSENYNDDYFQLMDAIGATDLNGTTSNDRTNYFENVPVSVLDKILWIESDRMGYLLGVVDSSKLDEQRGVVQNEKRQGENQPYAIARELTLKSTYPANHPYSWTVIGSMDDLNAASLNDVKDWFKTYYGPNNAVIVIAGDVNAGSILQKVKKYFGGIPATPPIAKNTAWVAKMSGIHRQVAQDRVPQARLQNTWNVPGWGTQEATYLDLLSSILTNGKTSRLYKRLVYDEQIATNVSSYIYDREIGGQFIIVSDAKPGIALEKINRIIAEEIKKIVTEGPTAAELERAKTTYFADFVKGMERIGGFGGKSDILAQNETFGGSADHYKEVHTWIKNAVPANIRKAGNQWLTDGEYVLEIQPYGNYTAANDSMLNRKQQPPFGITPAIKFPPVNEFTLSNGLKIVLVERKSVPVINMSLMVNAGYAADQFGLPGLASFTMGMMDEGTKTKNSLQISDLLSDLGATLNSSSDLDYSYLSMTMLKTNFDPSLNLFKDVLFNPSFPQKDFDRIKKEKILQIKQEESRPVTMGLRVLPKLLYGKGHAYSNPYTGSGTEESINKITRNELAKFHQTWFAPNNAVLIVAGDVNAGELKAKLESGFATWQKQSVPEKNTSDVALPAVPTVFIVDKPGALQSVIFAAELSPSGKDADRESIGIMNKILGGEFTSRINMNLREGKHWSYGSFSIILDAIGPSLFTAYAPVQTDKTKESIVEVQKELTQFVSSKPVSDSEFNKVQKNAVAQLPGSWETNAAVLSTLQDAIKYNRGVAYLSTYASMLQNLKIGDIQKAAGKVVKPGNLTWLIVGDRAKVENGIKELNLGVIKYIDTEGNEVK
ncbi:MAG: pitrilysin family protein [Ginsengibacter sp.]